MEEQQTLGPQEGSLHQKGGRPVARILFIVLMAISLNLRPLQGSTSALVAYPSWVIVVGVVVAFGDILFMVLLSMRMAGSASPLSKGLRLGSLLVPLTSFLVTLQDAYGEPEWLKIVRLVLTMGFTAYFWIELWKTNLQDSHAKKPKHTWLRNGLIGVTLVFLVWSTWDKERHFYSHRENQRPVLKLLVELTEKHEPKTGF